MSSKSDYTAEEWAALVRAPLLAGIALTLADPGGPIEAARETIAAMKTMTTAGSEAELLVKVAHEAKGMLEARKNPLDDFKPDVSRVGEQVLDRVEEARHRQLAEDLGALPALLGVRRHEEVLQRPSGVEESAEASVPDERDDRRAPRREARVLEPGHDDRDGVGTGQAAVGRDRRGAEVALEVEEARREGAPLLLVVRPPAAELGDGGLQVGAPRLVGVDRAREADDRRPLGELPLAVELEEGRDELSPREVAGAAEDDDRGRGGGSGAHAFPVRRS